MVPQQLGGLQEQRAEVLRNDGRITQGLTNELAVVIFAFTGTVNPSMLLIYHQSWVETLKYPDK